MPRFNFVPDLGALVNSPSLTDPEGLRWLAFLLLQPNLTTLYEYSLDFDHFTTIGLHIIGLYVKFSNLLLAKKVFLCIIY